MPDKEDLILARLDEIGDEVKATNRTLRGSNGHVGLLTRVDRIEQRHKLRIWVVGFLGSGSIISAIAVIIRTVIPA